MDKPELRLDPLTRDWTIFNEGHALPPVFGSVRGEALAPSPFRSGMERYASHALHHSESEFGWQVRVVPSRVPVFRVEGDCTPHADGLYEHMDGVGAHEVIIEDPGERSFEDLAPAEIERVLRAWIVRVEDLMRDGRLRAFTIVKGIGHAAGQKVAHSLSQLIAMAVVPPVLRRKLRHAREHFALKKRSLFADIIAHEQRFGSRVVRENKDFIVFCPYASSSAFELAVWPRRQCADFHRITAEEITSLAETLRCSLGKINRALDHPPCHFTLTTAPSRTRSREGCDTVEEDFRWHISIVPRLRPPEPLEIATGCHVNGVWPEVAADFLRSLADES
jgi:UDPglucose--hexose-1-phosphate uridylyltransferase